ncbi:MAG TPA: hypothetical protein VFW38_13200 [Solirubrobacteraceae bacterium]|nr:hypothetical protein [Solirubrobacteraceae bacterium]
MRLRLLTIVGTMALALGVPSAALAHNGRGRHHHHHRNRSRAHHAKFRVRNIGPGSSGSAPSTGTPTAPTEENAGTVSSYEKEVLTLTLKDNSTVSGKVTADTHIKCISPASSTEPGNEGPGDDNGAGDDQSRGDMNQSDGGWGGHKDGGDDHGEWDQQQSTPEPPCDTSSLTPGAVVRSAQLRVSPLGSEWECIVIVRSSS